MVKMNFEVDRSFAEKRIEGFALGAFFLWVGLAWVFDFPKSVPLFGVAVIVFLAQIARIVAGSRPQAFWLFLGLVFFLSGMVQMMKTTIDLVPVFFVAIGILIIARQLRALQEKKSKN